MGAIKYPTAESLMSMSHCAGCGETDPPALDDGLTACCGKVECEGVDPAEAQGACCQAVEARLESEAAAGHPAVRPASPPAPRPAARETHSLQNGSGDASLMSRTGGKGPQPAPPKEPKMASTRYLIAATASYPAKKVSTAKAARNEADARAKGDRVDVEVHTEATGKLVYTALGAPTMTALPAAPEAAPAVEAPVAAPAPVVAETAAPAAPAKTARRAALGVASVTGWELLYDKPKQGCEVGRRYAGTKAQYALICKAHGHVHELPRLTAERTLRAAGGWCPSC